MKIETIEVHHFVPGCKEAHLRITSPADLFWLKKEKPSQRTDRVEYIRRFLSVEIEAIKIHHLVPGRDEVLHEGLLGIVTSIDFSDGAQL